MVYRCLGHYFTLVLVTLGVMIVDAGIMKEQITFLIGHIETNFIPTEVEMEGNIVILLACFGVFLEHRHYLLEKVYPNGLPESVDQLDRSSHHVGVMFIFIAILTELLNLLFLTLNSWGVVSTGLKFAEISVLFSINAAAFLYLGAFAVRILKGQTAQAIT